MSEDVVTAWCGTDILVHFQKWKVKVNSTDENLVISLDYTGMKVPLESLVVPFLCFMYIFFLNSQM